MHSSTNVRLTTSRPPNRVTARFLAVAVLALPVALSGTSYAQDAAGSAVRLITGKAVKNGSLTGKDVRNRSLTAKDYKPGSFPAGPAGPAGRAGSAGPAGAPGAPGTPGADGTARAYGRVSPGEEPALSASKGIIEVRRVGTGEYCLIVPGVDAHAVPAAVTVDYETTLVPEGSGAAMPMSPCEDGSFRVGTDRFTPATGQTQFADNVGFTIVIP